MAPIRANVGVRARFTSNFWRCSLSMNRPPVPHIRGSVLVPQGQPRIAHRFNGGLTSPQNSVAPQGRKNASAPPGSAVPHGTSPASRPETHRSIGGLLSGVPPGQPSGLTSMRRLMSVATRFMAPIHVRILEVFPTHEPLVRFLTFAARFSSRRDIRE